MKADAWNLEMRLQPVDLGYFFYGTLMEGGKYYNLIKEYQDKLEIGYTHGELYYIDYIDENGEKCVTAALDPIGGSKISGYIFHPKEDSTLHIQTILDELEFNFHNKGGNNGRRDRVYLRNIIPCYNEKGEMFLSWCYLYHSTEHKAFLPVEQQASGNKKFNTISHSEYLKRRNNLKNKIG